MGEWVGSVRGGPPTRGRSVENFLSPRIPGGLYGGMRGPGSLFPYGGPPEYGPPPGLELGLGGPARKGIERSKSFSQGERAGNILHMVGCDQTCAGLKLRNLSTADVRPLPRPSAGPADFDKMRWAVGCGGGDRAGASLNT